MSDFLEIEALDSPERAAAFARDLYFKRRCEEAEETLNRAIGRWRGDILLHGALARMRWLRGAGDESTALLEAAIAERRADLKLRLVCADLMRLSGRGEQAREMLEEGLRRAPGSPAFMTSLGVVLDGLDRVEEALRLLRAAAAKAPHAPNTIQNLIPTLLRASRPDEALRLIQPLLAQSPHDQQLIAYQALALRMTGDPAYRDLYNYDRLVRIYELSPPPGFRTIAAFNEALAEKLDALHWARRHPIDQSLRGGTQTDRNLSDYADQTIDAFLSAVDEPIKDYIAELNPLRRHPVDERGAPTYRLSGSWSVRLNAGGFHINHVHRLGWLSSAYYVDVSDECSGEDRAGWLKFGEPSFNSPGFEPEFFVKPRAGTLVLFPSYLWHGTEPFGGDRQRLTAAFDVAPG